jgi:hypothetical protein
MNKNKNRTNRRTRQGGMRLAPWLALEKWPALENGGLWKSGMKFFSQKK